ncbi:MAG: phospholipase D-like domain-containing protein, partial [Thermoproteaceae archaeon]|nr:phospholipase D-like domain-containing protein [Thermoproteaceae archaeon]
IVKHAEAKFGSIDRVVEEFIDNVIKSLEDHEKEIQNYYTTGTQRVVIDPKVGKIVDKLRDKYMNLVNNDIILDVATFLNHIVISRQDVEIARELQLSVREFRERLTDAVIVSGINTCIDGCTACVMLDHGCTAPLVQNIMLSRNLTAWILRVLTGKAAIKGRGNILGPAIFYQAKEGLFALSPYLDKKGVKILTELAQRGVKVTLVTRKEFAERFGEQLKKHGIKVCITKTPRHDKFYIIDGRVYVRTTQNLSRLSSINEFSLVRLKPEEAESIVRQELKSDLVECYGES